MSHLIRLRHLTLPMLALAITVAPDLGGQTNNAPPPRTSTRPVLRRAANFTVRAPDLTSRGRIGLTHVYNGMGCTGQNISPALEWSNAPAGTRSFAVTAYDPDAPTGSGWWHWVMYNIPANVTSLPAGAGNGRNAPRGSTQGPTDFGTKGYGGPCPPAGDRAHHYQFTVFALKVDRLNIPGNATPAYVGFNLNANKLATARVTGLYAR
jgi:Raf kinase inhibitor-like YbhB/YbcL family protein